MDVDKEMLPDRNPEEIFKEYQGRLGKEIRAYRSYNINQINFMWLRDRLWFIKQLVADFGMEEAKIKLAGLIDQKALEIGTRYKKWAQDQGITNPILAVVNGYSHDWPWIWPSVWLRYYPDDKDPSHLIQRLTCFIGDFWKEQPLEYREFGRIMCDVDKKLARHIDPRLTLEVPNYVYALKGEEACHYCKFVWTLKD